MRRVAYFTYSVYRVKIEDGATHSRASASLMKAGVEQGQVYFSNYNTESIQLSLSQSLVLQCDAREKVWMESPYDNNYIDGYSTRNVFAGFLLFMK